MNETVAKLLDILKQQYTYYETLFDLTVVEKKLILSLDTIGLLSITEEKEQVAQKLQVLESDMNTLVNDISKMLGLPSKEISLKEIIECIDDENKEELRNIRENLISKVELIKKMNNENNIILEKSLDFINLAMSRFRNALCKNVAYGRSGKNVEKVDNGALLTREV